MRTLLAWSFGVAMTATEFFGLCALADWSNLRSWGVFAGCVALSALLALGLLGGEVAR